MYKLSFFTVVTAVVDKSEASVEEGAGVTTAANVLDPNFFLHISSSWVKIRLPTENQLPRMPVSALIV